MKGRGQLGGSSLPSVNILCPFAPQLVGYLRHQSIFGCEQTTRKDSSNVSQSRVTGVGTSCSWNSTASSRLSEARRTDSIGMKKAPGNVSVGSSTCNK